VRGNQFPLHPSSTGDVAALRRLVCTRDFSFWNHKKMAATIKVASTKSEDELTRVIDGRRAAYGPAELQQLIRPKSVAIVGASATPGSFGYRSIENTQFGYGGRVFLVNPRHKEILGVPCFPTLADIPAPVDCAILAMSETQVIDSMEQCAAIGVGAAIIYASGFRETGTAEGEARHVRLTGIAQAANMRVLGPNCLGVMNFVDRVGLTFQPGLNGLPMIKGRIGVVVQSGALGFIITQGMQRGLGFSYTVAPGNSCDVDACDLINFLIEDDHTQVVACVLEGINDGERFLAVARKALAAGKIIVANKMGNNALSGLTAKTHTGALMGSLEAYHAAFEKTGVIAVDDFEAVLETAAFFSKQRPPSAKGIGVMSASGGAAVMAADKALAVQVDLPPLAPATSAKLRERMPNFGSSANPCDITAVSLHDKTMYGHCIKAFADDPSFAAVVVPMMSAFAPSTAERAEYLCDLAKTLDKPVCIVWLNEWYQGPGSEHYDASQHLSVFRSMRRCFETLRAWFDYHERKDARLRGAAARVSDPACRERALQLLDRHQTSPMLLEHEAKALLATYGIGVTREALTGSVEEAVRVAGSIGFPVAMKGQAKGLEHKSDAGIVHLGVNTPEDVAARFGDIDAAVTRLSARAGFRGVLVQEMIGKGVELIVGLRRDDQFGPLIVCGLGGVLVELMKDTSCALAPVSRKEALAMLKRLKGFPLLNGYRGAPPVALEPLLDVICRLSELAVDLGDRVKELDVNPVICSANRAVAVDALVYLDETRGAGRQ